MLLYLKKRNNYNSAQNCSTIFSLIPINKEIVNKFD